MQSPKTPLDFLIVSKVELMWIKCNGEVELELKKKPSQRHHVE